MASELSSTVSTTIASVTSNTSNTTTITHTVTVGKTTNQFDPDSLTTSIGDVVTFEFYPSNHSVVRAQYEYPCIPYEDVVSGGTGFFSGFFPVSTIYGDTPSWNLTINDTSPIFFYCSAPGSCINYGMVGVINPNASTSITVQKALAKDADYMLQPGEDFPSEASASVSSIIASFVTITATDVASSSLGTGSAVGTSLTEDPGVVAGIVIGSIALILGIIGGAVLYLKRRRAQLPKAQSPISLPTTAGKGLQNPGYSPLPNSPKTPGSGFSINTSITLSPDLSNGSPSSPNKPPELEDSSRRIELPG